MQVLSAISELILKGTLESRPNGCVWYKPGLICNATWREWHATCADLPLSRNPEGQPSISLCAV